MRELKYYVACTVDGFIARRDGSFSCFPNEGEHFADLIAQFPETFPTHTRVPLNITSPNRVFDTVLMGRRTYQVGLDLGITSPYAHLKQYILSRTLGASPSADVELMDSDPRALVAELKRRAGAAIWLCGGSQLAAQLYSDIDELILKVNPIVIGDGIPLFADGVPVSTLRLSSSVAYPNGFLLNRYRRVHG